MPRARKPSAAAKKIIEKIDRGEAKDAEDAIAQEPSLEPGLAFLRECVQGGVSAGAGSGTTKTRTRPSGSGPALLER